MSIHTDMDFKRWLERDEKRIPENAIKVALPSMRQQTKYSCGATVLRAVCDYFKIDGDEQEFIDLLDSNDKDGTWPENIVKVVAKLGLKVDLKTDMTVGGLKGWIGRGVPVICAMQAWGKQNQYDKNQSGHYVAAIGYDDDNIYFEDPTMKITRGFLPVKRFEERWHDVDAHGRQCVRMGIAIWKDAAAPDKKKRRAKLIK